MAALRYETVFGADVRPFISDLARLRIQVFAEFPYLYAGELGYEEAYLQHLADCRRSVLVVAFDDAQVVGCSTALPLIDGDAEFQQPFREQGYDLQEVFYFGESVLDARYRGHGAGRVFFDEREAAARRGGFRWASFCAVQRSSDHPARPEGYRPLDAWWQRRGFERHPELHTEFRWKEIGQTEETAQPMIFWLKELR
ncbi:MAG: hypothetical protein E1N59_2679 [Puniceicoccaceae bacterium 5H]|nr:MAG: hypothetical protein E1N59_2679 [Puniceicoccaceae bacterium 5H]